MGSLTALLAVLLLATTPAADRVDWMRPDAYHLTIGMKRFDAMTALKSWEPKRGASDEEVVVDFSGERALTLLFKNDRLTSVRFELYVLLPETRKAFDEARARLLATRGEPRQATRSVLVYDNVLPNILVVVADDPKSEQGKKGVGVLAVRYYDPR